MNDTKQTITQELAILVETAKSNGYLHYKSPMALLAEEHMWIAIAPMMLNDILKDVI